MRVAVVGAGHVGLVTAACLAEKGHEVVCADIDEDRVRSIAAGESFIYEPGLDELVRRNVPDRLGATTNVQETVRASELTLIAVSVPLDRGADEALEPLRSASQTIGMALRGRSDRHTVVVKSTVLPGTTNDVVRPLVEAESGRDDGAGLGVAMNPEFLTEGTAVSDFMDSDRIVLGANEKQTLEALERLYEAFPGARIRTSPTTAELIKLASNALLATAISFANELAEVAASRGDVDVAEVTRGIRLSRYLTPDGETTAPLASYLEAGCGFGGSCLPKDLAALHRYGRAIGAPMELLEAVDRVNRGRAEALVRLAERALDGLDGARISVLGLAFKPDTSDVRESPAFQVVALLRDAGAEVRVYDPVATDAFLAASPAPVPVAAESLSEALEADAAVIVTRWSEFEQVPALLRDRPDPPLIVDGRRMLSPGDVPRYAGIGLGESAAAVADAAR